MVELSLIVAKGYKSNLVQLFDTTHSMAAPLRSIKLFSLPFPVCLEVSQQINKLICYFFCNAL